MTIMMRLREETASEHLSIEATVEGIAPSSGLDAYRTYLARTLGFVEPLEDRLVELLGREPIDWHARRKADRLRRDLRGLGLDDAAIAALPRAPDFAASLDAAAAWGAAYVLEGSTLGGQLLRRSFGEALGPDAGDFLYLAPYGERQGAMWRDFKSALTTRAEEGAVDPDAVVAGARSTFEAMRAWLGDAAR